MEINERNIDIKLKKSLTKRKLKLESKIHYIVSFIIVLHKNVVNLLLGDLTYLNSGTLISIFLII